MPTGQHERRTSKVYEESCSVADPTSSQFTKDRNCGPRTPLPSTLDPPAEIQPSSFPARSLSCRSNGGQLYLRCNYNPREVSDSPGVGVFAGTGLLLVLEAARAAHNPVDPGTSVRTIPKVRPSLALPGPLLKDTADHGSRGHRPRCWPPSPHEPLSPGRGPRRPPRAVQVGPRRPLLLERPDSLPAGTPESGLRRERAVQPWVSSLVVRFVRAHR